MTMNTKMNKRYPLTSDILFGDVPAHVKQDMIAENFWRHVLVSKYEIERVDHVGDGGKCWLWTGKAAYGTSRRGYGQVTGLGRPEGSSKMWSYAHRVSYVLHRGDIPAGQVVRHTCGNPLCVNPWHLTIGSQGDNIRDRGLACKYSSEETMMIIREIRFFCRKGLKTQKALAAKYGISKSTVSKIARGESWA